MNRRDFLKRTSLAAAAALKAQGPPVTLDPNDPIASTPPVKWAAGELQQALTAPGIRTAADLRILGAGASAPGAREILSRAKIPPPQVPESFALIPGNAPGETVLACASDARGLVYALLELTDQVRQTGAIDVRKPIVERPANQVRSIARCFVSDVEDKPWYNDRSMWPPYLSMLAGERFNRFSLTLGIGYDFTRQIRDCYFHFAYPFLVSPPGHDVRVTGLPEGERERNLEMLRFISDQTEARGLHFQLGLWTHAYQWTDSPAANHIIQGLTPENHAAYCREALYVLLQACPAIRGITFRVHGESGIAEGSYEFWKTVFEGILRTGRRIEIDMHAKGMDQAMINVALSTGLPVNISPKYWAEHMGLSYHQASIRELEMPRQSEGFFALSSGSRRFLRYGYGDLLAEDRRYGVLHRIWPGTQRLLLWGDPALAAGYGRASSFCGSVGVELCEPLSFKGRKGSGIAGGRTAYADRSLAPRYDWQKYLYTYRLWGRLLYNPDADPGAWRRYLRKQFRSAAPAAEAALANASRILPLVTTAHGASAANNSYWPEVYTNMPIVDAALKHPYSDSPSPRRFGTVSPFDPELFSRIDDEPDYRYSPLEVAQWLEDLASAAAKQLAQLESEKSPELRRLAIDVAIESGLGRFFAWKIRSGVLYALFERTNDRSALEEALRTYRAARSAWSELATRAKGVYAPDISFGYDPHLRGHWLGRLPAIDADVAAMERRLAEAQAQPNRPPSSAVRAALTRPRRPSVPCHHTPPPNFRPGQPLAIELSLPRSLAVRLHYRHVNQVERYRVEEMKPRDNLYRVLIPADYTHSPYPLLYFFELRDEKAAAWLYPGFNATLSNQPYFIVRQG